MLKSQISRTGFDGKQKIKNISKFIITTITVAVVVLLGVYSCKDKIIAPINDPGPKPGRRDYVWEIDTINPGPDYRTYGFNIWGAAPNDIWLVGSADTRLHTTWHYDGKKWSAVQLNGFVEGAGIWGFGSDNIWMGTSNSSIWHYDGISWKKFGDYKYKDYDVVIIDQIHGINENEIYGVGLAGMYNSSRMTRILMKYDGVKWDFVDIPELNEVFAQVKVDSPSGNVFITAERHNLSEKYLHLYLYKDNQLTELATSDNFMTLGTIGKRVYITMESFIYTYENNELKIFTDFTGTEFLSRLWGKNESDFFTVNKGSNIGHFNGSNLVNVFKVNAGLNRAVVFENDIFMHAKNYDSPYRDIVIHGKLK